MKNKTTAPSERGDGRTAESPTETIQQALSLLNQGIEAAIREAVTKVKGDPGEILRASDAARDAGFTHATVSNWCSHGLIEGAFHHGHRGHWRFTRGNWEAFLRGSRRVPRLNPGHERAR